MADESGVRHLNRPLALTCLKSLARPRFQFDQDRLLPSARRLIGPVDAARPTAGAPLALEQLFAGPFYPALARGRLFGFLDPADKLIPAERRQAVPQSPDCWIGPHRGLKVVGRLVNGSVGKIV